MEPVTAPLATYPPRATLPLALNSSNLSVLATHAFADPNSGYLEGLRLASAISDNNSGRFNLVSGLTVAGGAVSNALAALQDIQETTREIQVNAAVLDDLAASEFVREDARAQLEINLKELREQIAEADIGGFNLLDRTRSDGIALDLKSGALTNLGKTPNLDGSGIDQRFAFSPDRISFQTSDLVAAFDDLNGLLVSTFPNATNPSSGPSALGTVSRFQTTLEQVGTALNGLKKNLNQAAVERLTVSFDGPEAGSEDAASARQIASRLAQQLSSSSFNITANPAIRFFSLFT
jgi:hypothetical protein